MLASFLDSVRDLTFKYSYLAGRRLAQFIKYLRLPIRGVFLAIRGGVCRATIQILTLDPISDQDERGNPSGTFM